ncbi:Molybdopterin biosynthesis protein MoeA [hydrothermal vent metagenome]|uniref:molybdopterin molybdotransferase n=1 Tax=hydrothermal vent metagenome TaxID=652676 RepID=A0A3B0WAW0_9ZZZZ
MTYPKSINHSQAAKLIKRELEGSALGTELMPLNAASGRILAQPITAPIDVPAFACSRMDGFAINLHHLPPNKQTSTYVLALGEAIHAAAQSQSEWCVDRAIPIMTGGMLPSDANAIVLKEHGTIKENKLHFSDLPNKDQYIRTAGADLKQGQMVIKSGQSLTVAHLGLLSSLGLSEVEVFKRPLVALMMTGDELVQPGSYCLPGQVYDANKVMLSALLTGMGCDVQVLDTLTDSEAAVTKRMASLQQLNCDVIISVGGVSMGDKDWIPSVLEEQGEVVFHKVRVKPGFPMIFGRLKNTLFYGLPGNPVSAYTTLCQYVFPLIRKLNKQSIHKLTWRVSLSHDLNKTHYRREYLRGYYDTDSDGRIQVTVCGGQQSSRIESLAGANCFVVLDESQYDLKTGASISIQPFLQFKT